MAPDLQIRTTLNNNTHAKVFTSMLHAHFIDIKNPGIYEEELNKTLSITNLPTIKIINNPPSHKIIKKIPQGEKQTAIEAGENNQGKHKKRKLRKKH